jgi:RND family efflux transporter MFP subunit
VRYRAGGRDITLAAPTAGAVLGVYGEVGDYVDPLMPLVTLGDTRSLRSVLDVFEKDIGKIRKGQDVTIRTSAFPEDTFKGKVVYISPRVDEDTRTIKVRVDIENPNGKLKFGMFVGGHILVDTHPAIVVPETALETIDGSPSIFVFKDPLTLAVRRVKVGEKIDGHVEILAGLNAGDKIVSEGSFILKNEAIKEKNKESGAPDDDGGDGDG